jgi:hypothetical protein
VESEWTTLLAGRPVASSLTYTFLSRTPSILMQGLHDTAGMLIAYLPKEKILVKCRSVRATRSRAALSGS